MKSMAATVLLVAASLGLPGRAPGAARADNSPFGGLLTTINNLGPEVAALQAVAPFCQPSDPCVPAGTVTLIDAGTLAGFNQGSFNNTVLHNASSILALRAALGALDVAPLGCIPSDLPVACGESLTAYLTSQRVDLATVVAAVGIPPTPVRLYYYPGDPCLPQLTVVACKG